MGWTAYRIPVWVYIEHYIDDDDVRLIKGTEKNRIVQVLVKDGTELKSGATSLRSFM